MSLWFIVVDYLQWEHVECQHRRGGDVEDRFGAKVRGELRVQRVLLRKRIHRRLWRRNVGNGFWPVSPSPHAVQKNVETTG